MNLTGIAKSLSDPDKARAFLEKQLWPHGVVCPHCGLVGESFRLTAKPNSKNPIRKGVWKCSGCRKNFTVTVGTIFEGSHIPLNTWLMAIHLLCSSKKGMSAHQLHRMLGITYKSAWFMAHRIRYALTQKSPLPKLSGIVEVDETYIGGKFRTGPQSVDPKKRAQDKMASSANKAPVLALVQRGGDVYSQHLQRVNSANLKPVIQEMIADDAIIMTDSGTSLHGALMPRQHYQVNHRRNEYVRKEKDLTVSTNSAEGYFSILKRGIIGVYHHVGKQHLHRYLCEFDFRYNMRKVTDGERSEALLHQVTGKRLVYKQMTPPF